MMVRKIYRTRCEQAYRQLYRDPGALFGGCKVFLYPNGNNEIWIESNDGKMGFRVEAGYGPAGLVLNIHQLPRAGQAKVDVADQSDYTVTIVQYRDHPWAQKFREWYQAENKEEHPYPGEPPEELHVKEDNVETVHIDIVDGYELRMYDLGKYRYMVDAYVHQMSLSGLLDESVGSVSEIGWWSGLVKFGKDEDFKDEEGGIQLTESEREFLKSRVGAIITEDDQGFVEVEYFDSETDLEGAWNRTKEAEAEVYKLVEDGDGEG